jgi:hypothetical protein
LANITLYSKTNKKQLSILIKGDFLHNILTLHKKATELPKPMGSLTTTINNTIATVQFSHPASNSFPRKLLDSLSELNQLSVIQMFP